MASSFRRRSRSLVVLKLIVRILIWILLILGQLLIYYLIIFQINNIPYITVISTIISLLVVTHIYNSDKNISYKLSWIFVCTFFNLIGSVFYFIYGSGKALPKKKANTINSYLNDKLINNNYIDELKVLDQTGYKHARILHYSTDGYPMYKNIPNTFFKDGRDMYNDMIEKLKNSKKYIFLEFFIIREGSVFDEIINLLIDKANNGVSIRIIYDAYGSGISLKKKTIKYLSSIVNIEIASYNPLYSLYNSINYRDHRKIVVIDGLYAYTGGMNLADEYVHRKKKYGFWRDTGLLIESHACRSYILLFTQNWYLSTKEMLLVEDYIPIYPEYENNDTGYIYPYGDAPTNKKNASYNLFLSLINNAKKSIYISTPYFVIDSTFIDALVHAIKSGIEVKILIPDITDNKLFFPTTLAHLKNIILNKGSVYRYTPGFNHSKSIIVDSKYAFIGTVNIDYRSLFLNFECGNLLINTSTVKEIELEFLESISKSRKIEIDEWKKRPIISKIKAFVFTLLGPLL